MSGGFSERVLAAWERNQLVSVLVELTYRCNLDCFFCYNDVNLRGRPLALEQYLAFFRDLAEMQVLNLVLSGGEPLAHPEFLRLGRAAREMGFVVRIKSNGHALRGALARRVREEVDPFVIEVSLHGATAATHDRQTRVPGSFDRLLANLREAREVGLRVKINATLTAWNEHELAEIFALADELGLALQIDPEVTPRDDGARDPLGIAASRAAVARLYRIQAERAGDSEFSQISPAVVQRQGDGVTPAAAGKHCGAGSSGITVDPYGNVYPCVQWRRPVGNLHQQSILDIWSGSRGLVEVRELATAVSSRLAREGSSAAFLNFCPGNAESATGDPLAIYPAAQLRREVMEELVAIGKRRSPLPVLP